MMTIAGLEVEELAVSVTRRERREYKYQLVTESGRQRGELRARYPVYELTLGNVDQTAYDALREALASDAQSVTVTMPDGQRELTFEAIVTLGEDGLLFLEADGTRRWDGLTVTVEGVRPL